MALAGFDLIDDYGDASAEARACRTNCALFDFSFLESARLSGVRARGVIEAFAGRSLRNLSVGKICYTLRVSPTDHVIADLTIWRTGPTSYEVMSGRQEDVEDLLRHADADLEVTDMTSRTATFALQGPRSLEVLRSLCDVGTIQSLPYFGFVQTTLAGLSCRIGRLGYTGEAGFEIIFPRGQTRFLWQSLSLQARPAGFIAADMLRIEAGFVLFTNEFHLPVSPLEAGLGRFHDHPGRAAPKLTLVSFSATAGIPRWPWVPPRELSRPTAPNEIVVTSACDSNAARGILGLGYILADSEAVDLCDPTGVFRNIRRVPRPFYDPTKLRPRAIWRGL